MNYVHFPGLTSVDSSNLEEVSIDQASRQSTNWKASNKLYNVCQCKDSSITDRYCCEKKGMKCSTKCHVNNHRLSEQKLKS